MEEQYGTSLDRVKYLCTRIWRCMQREDANVGESRLAAEYFLENMVYCDSGKKVESPNMRVTKRKNKTIFNYIGDENEK